MCVTTRSGPSSGSREQFPAGRNKITRPCNFLEKGRHGFYSTPRPLCDAGINLLYNHDDGFSAPLWA